MPLAMKTQVAAKLETIEGTAVTLSASDLVDVFLSPTPVGQMRYGKVERPIATGSLTKQRPLGGAQEARFPAIAVELSGPLNGSAASAPAWSKLMRACGMRVISAKKHAIDPAFTVGTVFNHNDVFTADVSGAQGRILGAYYDDEDSFIVYEVIGSTAISASDTAIVVSGGASADLVSPGTIASAQVWEPYDTRVSVVTTGAITNPPFNVGDEILGGTSGARGRITQAASASPLYFELADGSVPFVSGETVSEVGGTTSAVAGSNQFQTHTPSITLATLHEAVRLKGKGVRGTWSLIVRPDGQPLLVFEFAGAAMDAEDAGLLISTGINSAVGPTVKGSVLTIDGVYAPVWDSIEFRGNNTLFVRPNQSDSTGLKSCRITDRNHQTVLGVELVREAIYPTFARTKSKAPVRLKWKADGGTANTFEVRQPAVSFDDTQLEDGSGLWNMAITADARAGGAGAGGDETVLIMY